MSQALLTLFNTVSYLSFSLSLSLLLFHPLFLGVCLKVRHKLKGNGSNWKDGPPKTPTTTNVTTSQRWNHNNANKRVIVDKKEKQKTKTIIKSSSVATFHSFVICNSNRDSDYALSTVKVLRSLHWAKAPITQTLTQPRARYALATH